MLLKLVLVMMWCAAADADLLAALAGARGGNRVSLCMRGQGQGQGRRCGGVLWRGQWVAARASCLQGRALHQVRVLRDSDGLTCDLLHNGIGLWQARKVRVQFVHPEYCESAPADLALLAVEEPYRHLEPLVNSSTAQSLLAQFSPWMEDVYNQFPLGPHRVSYAHKSSWFSTPLRMFVTSIVLPCVSFMLFFMFVIFFTGNEPEDQIPYKSIEYEKYEESEKSDFGDTSLEV